MGKYKDLSEFCKGLIVMASWLGQHLSKVIRERNSGELATVSLVSMNHWWTWRAKASSWTAVCVHCLLGDYLGCTGIHHFINFIVCSLQHNGLKQMLYTSLKWLVSHLHACKFHLTLAIVQFQKAFELLLTNHATLPFVATSHRPHSTPIHNYVNVISSDKKEKLTS